MGYNRDELAERFDQGTSVDKIPKSGESRVWEEQVARRGYRTEMEMWEDLYIQKKNSISQLAQMFEVSNTSIRFRFAKFGIPSRARGGSHNLCAISACANKLRELGITIDDLKREYPNPFQAAKAIGLKPYQMYSYLRMVCKGGGTLDGWGG